MSARLDFDHRLRMACLAAWLIGATALVAGVTSGTARPLAVAGLVASVTAGLLVPSTRLGLATGIVAGLAVTAWIFAEGGGAAFAGVVGMVVIASGAITLVLSSRRGALTALSEDRPRTPSPAGVRLPPGVADEALLERLTVHEMTRARRYERPLTLLLVGVEDWATISAGRGRRGAHDLLGTLATRLRRLLRDVDAIGMHGDGQLAILLPETPLEGALVVASRIEQVATNEVGLKIRLGASVFPDDAGTVVTLMREAEAALELARLEQLTIAERAPLA